MNTLKYQGYTARIEFDEEDRLFSGRLLGIEDVVTFHGETVDELEQAFREAVDHYIEVSERIGRPMQKPYSGKMMLRVGEDVHAAAAMAADAAGMSLNKWATEVIGEAARGEGRSGSATRAGAGKEIEPGPF